MRIKAWIFPIDIHQIKEIATNNSRFQTTDIKNRFIQISQFFLLCRQFRYRATPAIVPLSNRGHAPIVEYRRTTIFSTESLGILCTLTQFLSEVYHHRPRIHHRRNDQCREDFIGITGKLVGSEALFVMIFEKIQHFSSYSIDRLPTISELGSRYLMTQYPSQFIVQSYFII